MIYNNLYHVWKYTYFNWRVFNNHSWFFFSTMRFVMFLSSCTIKFKVLVVIWKNICYLNLEPERNTTWTQLFQIKWVNIFILDNLKKNTFKQADPHQHLCMTQWIRSWFVAWNSNVRSSGYYTASFGRDGWPSGLHIETVI